MARFMYRQEINVPELMVKGGRTYRLVKDHLGSVRLVVDTADGTIMQEMRYDAWGNVVLDTNPGFQPFGFAGGLYDPQTRLVRFGARDYDAQLGRWMGKDPLLFWGSTESLFEYAASSPLTLRDPRGEDFRDLFCELGYGGKLECCVYYGDKCAKSGIPCGNKERAEQKQCASGDLEDEQCYQSCFSCKAFNECFLKKKYCQKYFRECPPLGFPWPPIGTWPPEVPGEPKLAPAPYRPRKGSGYPPPRPWARNVTGL
jgi:RHS repeat-associated protein